MIHIIDFNRAKFTALPMNTKKSVNTLSVSVGPVGYLVISHTVE